MSSIRLRHWGLCSSVSKQKVFLQCDFFFSGRGNFAIKRLRRQVPVVQPIGFFVFFCFWPTKYKFLFFFFLCWNRSVALGTSGKQGGDCGNIVSSPRPLPYPEATALKFKVIKHSYHAVTHSALELLPLPLSATWLEEVLSIDEDILFVLIGSFRVISEQYSIDNGRIIQGYRSLLGYDV